MLNFLLGGIKLGNLNIDAILVGLDVSGETVFSKSIQIYGSDEITDFVEDYLNKNWHPILVKYDVSQYLSQVNVLVITNIKTFVKR